MATLYIDRKDLHIRGEGGRLVITEPNRRPGSIPLTMVDRVVVRSAVTITSGALTLLAESGIGVTFLSPRRSNRITTMVGLPHADVRRRLAQMQAYLDPAQRRAFSLQLVRRKLVQQSRFLMQVDAVRSERRRALKEATEQLREAIERLADPQAIDLPISSLLGIEGAAAAAYFSGFTALFAPELMFEGRNRRPPRDPVNVALSLGYTLLHNDAILACHAAGLDPYLGLYHEPAYGRESLASDLIEPLRAYLDRWVWQMFRERRLRLEHFQTDRNACLLGKSGRQHFYAGYELFARPIRRLLRRQCFQLLRELDAIT